MKQKIKKTQSQTVLLISCLTGLLFAISCLPASRAGILRQENQAEAKYADFSRALALETFDFAWELIRDTHYDEKMNGIDWEAIRVELRPQAAKSRNNAELRAILNDMVGRLNLSHFGIIPRERADALVHPTSARKSAASKRVIQKVPEGNAAGNAKEKSFASDRKGAKEEKTTPKQRVKAVSEGAQKKPRRTLDAGKPGIEVDKRTGSMRMRGEIKRDRGNKGKAKAVPRLNDGGIGLDVRILAGEVVVTEVKQNAAAFAAGLRPGWVIDAIDGESMRDLLTFLGVTEEGGSFGLMAWQAITNKFHGRVGSTLELTLRDGEDVETKVTLTRKTRSGQRMKFGNLPPMHVEMEAYFLADRGENDQIGVISFNLWMFPMIQPFAEAMETFADADGIIIDLRGNLGGVGALVMRTGGYFIDEKLTLGTMIQRGQELRFNVNPQRVSASLKRVKPYAGPVAILVDEVSASTTEIFAAGMQAHGRVMVFGTISAGAALPAAMDRLPNGDVLLHAIANLVDPNNESVEGRGVIPDEEVHLTRESLLAGRDLQLEAATAWISANRNYRWQGSAEK